MSDRQASPPASSSRNLSLTPGRVGYGNQSCTRLDGRLQNRGLGESFSNRIDSSFLNSKVMIHHVSPLLHYKISFNFQHYEFESSYLFPWRYTITNSPAVHSHAEVDPRRCPRCYTSYCREYIQSEEGVDNVRTSRADIREEGVPVIQCFRVCF